MSIYVFFRRTECCRWQGSWNPIGWHNILMYQDCISVSSIVSAFLPYMHINMLLQTKTALYAVLLTKLAKVSRKVWKDQVIVFLYLVFFASKHSRRRGQRNELGRQGRRVHITPTSTQILLYSIFRLWTKVNFIYNKFTNKTDHLQYA